MTVRDLHALLTQADPQLHPRPVAIVGLDGFDAPAGLTPIATVREREGLTLYLDEERARAEGLEVAFKAAWITLRLPSALDAVGFTAAFAAALTQRGISFNVVAGARHDHLFVPWERREAALAALSGLAD